MAVILVRHGRSTANTAAVLAGRSPGIGLDEVGRDQAAQIPARLGERGADLVAIAVSDNGIGIAEEDRLRIFERFYRVDYARSRATGGTGLGLSIVAEIAQGHGGDVTVWSKPGSGSTFTLTLPAGPSRANEEEPS